MYNVFGFTMFIFGVALGLMIFIDFIEPPKCIVQVSTVQPQKVICVLDQDTYIRIDSTHGWSADKGIYFYLNGSNSSDAQK